MIHFMDGPTKWELAPVENTEISQFYWLSNIKTNEIAEAFAVHPHSHYITQTAGEAIILGIVCTECGGPIMVASRSKALAVVKALDHPGVWVYGADHPDACRDCKKIKEKAAQKEMRERHERESRERSERRQFLRTMPYREYLQTPEWQAIRKGALYRAKYRCQTCASPGKMHVHHRTYVNRGDERSSDLIVLCADCHEIFHKNGKLAAGGRADTSSSTAASQ